MSQLPPGRMGLPFLGEALKFLKDPFAFTLERTRKHGNVWKTRILGDTVVFFAGPKAFTVFMNPDNFTRQSGSPKFLQQLLHPDAAADFTIMNQGAFAPPVNLAFTAYGKAIKARDRLRTYIKKAVAERDGAGSALGVLKAARGPAGEQLSAAELEIELLHFYF